MCIVSWISILFQKVNHFKLSIVKNPNVCLPLKFLETKDDLNVMFQNLQIHIFKLQYALCKYLIRLRVVCERIITVSFLFLLGCFLSLFPLFPPPFSISSKPEPVLYYITNFTIGWFDVNRFFLTVSKIYKYIKEFIKCV